MWLAASNDDGETGSVFGMARAGQGGLVPPRNKTARPPAEARIQPNACPFSMASDRGMIIDLSCAHRNTPRLRQVGICWPEKWHLRILRRGYGKRGKPEACIGLPPQRVSMVSDEAAETKKTVSKWSAVSVALIGERTVHLQNCSNFTEKENACQICGAKLRISEVEPHPERGEWEIQGFSCRNCGPVKSLVVKRLH